MRLREFDSMADDTVKWWIFLKKKRTSDFVGSEEFLKKFRSLKSTH
jgi:hypothetical protein